MSKVKLDEIKSYLQNVGVDSIVPEKENPFAKIKIGASGAVPSMPEIPYTVVVDSDHPDVGYCIVAEDQALTFYLPDGWEVRALRYGNIKSYLDNGATKIEVNKMALIGFDPMNQRSCIWYTPGADHARDFGAEPSPHYEFDRPREISTCSNPVIVAKYGGETPACEVEQKMAACAVYQKEPWVLERKANLTLPDGSQVSLYVETTRKGIGQRLFRIMKATEEGLPVLLDQISSVDHKDSVRDVLNEFFAARLKPLEPVSVELVEVTEKSEPERKYFDYVLSD